MKRADWKRKSERLSASAKVLFENDEYASAYYLAGLSVECVLKARIAGRFKARVIPDKRLVDSVYDHSLERLTNVAQLMPDLEAECLVKPGFDANWQIVKQWQVDARYRDWSEAEANDMVGAVTARGNGVLAWIRRNW